MTIKEKYLEPRQKSVNPKTKIDTCSPTLRTDQNLACIASFKRRNKPQNVLNISRGTSNMAPDMQQSLINHEKSSKYA